MNAYISYAARPSISRYASVVLLFLLGLLAKPMLVTLPILLMLLDYWPLNRIPSLQAFYGERRYPIQSLRFLIAEKLPLLVLAVVDGLATVYAQQGAKWSLSDLTIGTRLGNALNGYRWYLQKTFVPTNLTIYYPQEILPWSLIGLGGCVFLGVTAMSLWLGRTRPHWIVGWSWFAISLLPVIGLIQVGGQAYADRYAYVPHVGLFLLIVWEVFTWTVYFKALRSLVCLISVVALVACGLMTRAQLAYWKNSETLWSHSLDVIPDSDMAHLHLANVRMQQGNFEDAIYHIRRGHPVERGRVQKNKTQIANSYLNWGICLSALNRPEEAEQKFRAALDADPFHEASLNELSRLLEQQNRMADLVQLAQLAVRWTEQQPNNPSAQMCLGLMFVRMGKPEQAIACFQKAVELDPQAVASRFNLGLVQFQTERYPEAKQSFQRVLELNPAVAYAHYCLGQIFEKENDSRAARNHYSEAVRLDPNDLESRAAYERLSNR